jgi:hypothetical protein
MSINEVFGEAKFGGNKTNWFKFPKEGGSLILRILPPYGSLRKSGRWCQYYAVHFGYRDTKGNLRPFQSCEVINRRTNMVEVVDPAVERIKKIKMAQDKARLEGNEELVKKLGEQLKIFNLKKAYYMNVMDLQGKIGVISIPYRMKEALDAEIKSLQAKGINPISIDDGRFFVFTRTGFGSNTSHKVSVYKEEVIMNGMRVEVDKKHALTADVAERIQSEGADLGKLYIAPTSEEIAQIVAGDARTLEEIFAKYRESDDNYDGFDGSEDDDSSSTSTQNSSSTAQSVAQKAEQTSTTPAVETKQETTTAKVTDIPAQDLANMSTEDFLKSLGI